MTYQGASKAISVIGLGEMGAALARVLLSEGFTITGWNRSRDKAERLVEHGARIANSVLEAVTASPVIIACAIGTLICLSPSLIRMAR